MRQHQNGGLGRLAACFIDSLASLGVPAFGYGIQYKYGIFKQEFDKDGKQVETPDYWLANEEPWGHIDYNRDQKVSFGGKVVENADGTKTWQPAWSVRAVPVDYLVPGYKSGRVNTLRLWSAKSYDEFDLLAFNRSEYMEAVTPQVKAENISKILYPEDSTKVGTPSEARESMKQAARRPRPPLPRPGSYSASTTSWTLKPRASTALSNCSVRPALSSALRSCLPIRNSADR